MFQVAIPAAAPTTAGCGCGPFHFRGRYGTEELDADDGVEGAKVIQQATDSPRVEMTQRTPGVLPYVSAEGLRLSTWAVLQVLNVEGSWCRPVEDFRGPPSVNQLLPISIHAWHSGHAATAGRTKREELGCRRRRTRLARGRHWTLRGEMIRHDERFCGRRHLGRCRRHRRDCS